MLTEVTFFEDFRNFKNGDQLFFTKYLNCIVGSNGSGKSSLIDVIQTGKHAHVEVSGSKEYISFDFEKDNPRTKSYVDRMSQVATRFCSHGEAAISILKSIGDVQDKTIIMDEPDQSLDIKNCKQLFELMDKLVQQKCQLIVTIHNPYLIYNCPQVLDLDKKIWVSGKDYINKFWKINELK